jgi:phosphinothricin acetyltransferase
MSDVRVRSMAVGDWDRVRTIYEQGIAAGDATFETTAPSWDAWDASHFADHRLVAGADGDLLGWAALSPVSDRCVYAGVAENSVYVAETVRGCGVGRLLLDALIEGTEAAGVWTVQTAIFPENTASLHLHEGCGFRIVGVRERIGLLHGQWRETVFLERRSPLL